MSNPKAKVMSRNNDIYLLRDFDTTWGSKFRDIKFLFFANFVFRCTDRKYHKSI